MSINTTGVIFDVDRWVQTMIIIVAAILVILVFGPANLARKPKQIFQNDIYGMR